MRVASEVALSSTVVVVVVVVVAFVVCANTDDGAKVVPMIASAAITRLTIARTATNIIIIDRFIEQRKRTKLIRVPPDDAWKRFCDFVMMMMIDSRRASGRFYCLPVVAVVMHLYEASASRRYELTLARSVARSPVSTRKMMLEPEREISALPPSSSSLSRRFRSGASAARIEPATRPDLVDILILALQLFKVNVVRP
jgi:hypothetical protein